LKLEGTTGDYLAQAPWL